MNSYIMGYFCLIWNLFIRILLHIYNNILNSDNTMINVDNNIDNPYNSNADKFNSLYEYNIEFKSKFSI